MGCRHSWHSQALIIRMLWLLTTVVFRLCRENRNKKLLTKKHEWMYQQLKNDVYTYGYGGTGRRKPLGLSVKKEVTDGN